MKYQCQLNINASLSLISQYYQDKESQFSWQSGLVDIDMLSGNYLNEGSQAKFYFNFGDEKMVMKQTVESNQMPHAIIEIYEVDNVWNRVVNTFVEEGGHVLWTLESEFKFKEDIGVPQQRFEEKTLKGMELFKQYIENKFN